LPISKYRPISKFRNLHVAFIWVLACSVLVPISANAQSTTQASTARRQLVGNLRAHIHHVFLIYQENRSFDSYFGSFPGADNLATPEARAHGFRQWDAIGKTWITPFLLKAADSEDADHSREALIAKTDHGRMDGFVSYEEKSPGATPQLARQLGILTMAHEDCTTIPFLWLYAHRFALYDHIFQAMYGPSTPGNIDLIAGQTGQTQAARHPDEAFHSIFGERRSPAGPDLCHAYALAKRPQSPGSKGRFRRYKRRHRGIGETESSSCALGLVSRRLWQWRW
jgi:phospholipase C